MKKRHESKIAVFLVLIRMNNGRKEILLQERFNTGYMDGKYDMACSGHLEKGESLAHAVVREAKEEIGIEIDEKDLKLVSVIHPYQDDYLNVFFETKKYQGIPQIMEKDKCDDLQWFDIDNLPDNIMERMRKVLINIHNDILYDDAEFSIQKYNESKLKV